jgi:flagellar basal body-associated protein FliL
MGLSGAEIVFIALGLLLLVLLVAAICIAIYMIIRSSQKSSNAKPVEPPVFPPPALASVQHTEQQLRSLAKLRDEGVITPQDFEAKKRTLLGI